MTIGYRVLLARDVPDDGTSALLAHELVHVRQWARAGMVGFPVRYLSSFGRNLGHHRRWQQAYHDIEAEREARIETTDWLRRRARAAANRNGDGEEPRDGDGEEPRAGDGEEPRDGDGEEPRDGDGEEPRDDVQ
jgi:hypothetical protein